MGALIVVACLGLYFIGIPMMQNYPKTGYVFTYPLRFMFPFFCVQSFQPTEGALIGCGIALILSFEHKSLWKIGVALILISTLWHSNV